MSTLNEVYGLNKYCGPAVLSILTGRNTDECADAISRINNQHDIKGVSITDLLKAADDLGFNHEKIGENYRSLYLALLDIASIDGMYIVVLEKHFICIEVKKPSIYLCDNHTKSPINAASSARLSQKVLYLYKVTAKPAKPQPILLREYIVVTKDCNRFPMSITIKRQFDYTNSYDNRTILLASFVVRSLSEMNQIRLELGYE